MLLQSWSLKDPTFSFILGILYSLLQVQAHGAETLMSSRELLKGLKMVCMGKQDFSRVTMQVIHACTCASNAFCEAIAVTGLPQVSISPLTPRCDTPRTHSKIGRAHV